MAHVSITPQLVADLLVAAFLVAEAVCSRGPRLEQTDRGATVVFRGCCVVTLLALNSAAPSLVTAAAPIGWIGVIAAASGLVRILATLVAARAAPSRWVRRQADSLGNLVFWIGAATASLNVIAMLTVAVATLAATGVRLSAETAGTVPSASARALGGK